MGFSRDDRRLLLATAGIGPTVLQRLEEAGLDSLAALQAQGVDSVVERVGQRLQGDAWRNRRSALERALQAWLGTPGIHP